MQSKNIIGVVIVVVLLMATKTSYSQSSDSLVFAKNRFITGLFGSLTSQTINVSKQQNVTTVGYTIGTNSGVFVIKNLVVGLNFAISRYEFNNGIIALDAENLQLGLWSRYYFAVKETSALYAEIIPFYAGVNNETQVYDNAGLFLADEIVSGGGFGVQTGIGFTYLLNRTIGFGLTLHYSLASIDTDIEDRILKTSFSNSYFVNQLGFNFNFQVYLDEFFF